MEWSRGGATELAGLYGAYCALSAIMFAHRAAEPPAALYPNALAQRLLTAFRPQ